MRARLTIVLGCFFALALPAIAHATYPPPSGELGLIVGNLAYAQNFQTDDLRIRDLDSGAEFALPFPPGFAIWNEDKVARNGRFASTLRLDAHTSEVFVTDQSGIRVLSTWDSTYRKCGPHQRPLEITSAGAVRVLEVGYTQNKPGGTCTVDMTGTRLRSYAQDGSSTDLWLPSKYAAWLDDGSAELRGNRLLIYRPAGRDAGGRLVVLDIGMHRVVREVRTGAHFSFARTAAHDGALLVYRNGARVSARHLSFYLGRTRAIYAGRRTTVTACGQRTAIAGNGSIEIRGLTGRTLFRRSYSGNYATSVVVCSERFLHYVIQPNVPAMGEDPNLPPLHRGTVDMSRFSA